MKLMESPTRLLIDSFGEFQSKVFRDGLDVSILVINGWKFEKYLDDQNILSCYINKDMSESKILIDPTKTNPFSFFLDGDQITPNIVTHTAKELISIMKETMGKFQRFSDFKPKDPDDYIKATLRK